VHGETVKRVQLVYAPNHTCAITSIPEFQFWIPCINWSFKFTLKGLIISVFFYRLINIANVCFYMFIPLLNFESKGRILIVCVGRDSPKWVRASSFTKFLDHTQQRTSVGRTPLDEWSDRSRDLYLTTLTTYKRPCPPVGSEPTITSGERPQTYAIDRAATGTGRILIVHLFFPPPRLPLHLNPHPHPQPPPATNVLNLRLSNYILRHIDVSRADARCVAGKRKFHSASH
jgi:hypothetical protein